PAAAPGTRSAKCCCRSRSTAASPRPWTRTTSRWRCLPRRNSMVSVDGARLRASAPIRFLGCSVVCAAALFAGMAAAEYPEKPIRIVTPFPAGSVADAVARPIATHLAETWGQPVVVDNRGGAGGTIAAKIVAKSPPDGHTLLIGANGPNAVNPSLIKNLPYDSQRAFAAITIAATTNFLLTVPSSMPVKSVRDLIDVA